MYVCENEEFDISLSQVKQKWYQEGNPDESQFTWKDTPLPNNQKQTIQIYHYFIQE